jgi:hypothetical protein
MERGIKDKLAWSEGAGFFEEGRVVEIKEDREVMFEHSDEGWRVAGAGMCARWREPWRRWGKAGGLGRNTGAGYR